MASRGGRARGDRPVGGLPLVGLLGLPRLHADGIAITDRGGSGVTLTHSDTEPEPDPEPDGDGDPDLDA